MVEPLGHADKAEAHAEADKTANRCHKTNVRDLVSLDDARVVGLLEEHLQNYQVVFGILQQDFDKVFVHLHRTVYCEIIEVANAHKVEVVVVGGADIPERILRRIVTQKSLATKLTIADALNLSDGQTHVLASHEGVWTGIT